MLPDGVSNPGPLTYESGALPIALRGPAPWSCDFSDLVMCCRKSPESCELYWALYSMARKFSLLTQQ